MLARPLAVLALCSLLPAQAPESGSSQAPHPQLASLPADASNVLLIGDVLPHVDALLAAPALAKLLDDTQALQRQLFDSAISCRQLQAQLQLVRSLVPSGLAAAAPPATITSLLQLLRAGVDLAILLQPGLDDDLRSQLQANAAAALAAAPQLDAVVSMTLRDERTAESWFDQLRELLATLPADAGLQVEDGDQRLAVALQPLRLSGGRLAQLLRQQGIAAGGLAEFALRAELQQRGPTLALRFGKPAAGPLPAAAIEPLWAPGPGRLLFAHADWEAGTDVVVGMIDDLGTAFDAELDDAMQVVFGRLLGLLQGLLDAPTDGSMAIDVDRGVCITREEKLGGGVQPLDLRPPVELQRCIAPDDGPFLLSGLPLDTVLSATLEGGLQQALQRANERTFATVTELHVMLEDVVDFLAGEESAVFDAGTAVLTRAARFRGCRGWTAGEMPFAAVAVVAKAESAAAGRGFVDRLTQLLGEALAFDAGQAWADAELGLGVPTRELQLEALVPQLRALQPDVDFRPHLLLVDPFVVLSTDVALSRQLLQRLRSDAAPAASPGAQPVNWWQWRGEHLTAVCTGLGQWLEQLAPRFGSGPDAEFLAKMAPLLRTVAASAELLEIGEGHLTIDRRRMRELTRWQLRAGR